MIDELSQDILKLIGYYLNYKDSSNLLKVNKYINKELSEHIKNKFYYLSIIKLVNKDLNKFKKEISLLKPICMEKVFLHTLNHIETVWLNKSQGFYNMKYILECMLIGNRVDKSIQYQFNSTGSHFYQHFYQDLLNCITSTDRIIIQKNIDNCPKLKSLHYNFIPFQKY